MWPMGQYIRLAIESSVQNLCWYDGLQKVQSSQKYPKCPFVDEEKKALNPNL